MTQTTEQQIRDILQAHARLNQAAADLPVEADLYKVGMTSHASVNVMLALEGQFDIEFPDQMLNRNVFVSIASIRDALVQLGVPA